MMANNEGRLQDEELNGVFEYPDGTEVTNGKATKIGSRAIIEKGKLVGFRPDESDASSSP
jgi:hypothetical protein